MKKHIILALNRLFAATRDGFQLYCLVTRQRFGHFNVRTVRTVSRSQSQTQTQTQTPTHAKGTQTA